MHEKALQEYVEKFRLQGLAQGFEQGKIWGMSEQQIVEKQEILIRLLEKKFGLEPPERILILSESDTRRLNGALDLLLFAAMKQEVLEFLRCRLNTGLTRSKN